MPDFTFYVRFYVYCHAHFCRRCQHFHAHSRYDDDIALTAACAEAAARASREARWRKRRAQQQSDKNDMLCVMREARARDSREAKTGERHYARYDEICLLCLMPRTPADTMIYGHADDCCRARRDRSMSPRAQCHDYTLRREELR